MYCHVAFGSEKCGRQKTKKTAKKKKKSDSVAVSKKSKPNDSDDDDDEQEDEDEREGGADDCQGWQGQEDPEDIWLDKVGRNVKKKGNKWCVDCYFNSAFYNKKNREKAWDFPIKEVYHDNPDAVEKLLKNPSSDMPEGFAQYAKKFLAEMSKSK